MRGGSLRIWPAGETRNGEQGRRCSYMWWRSRPAEQNERVHKSGCSGHPTVEGTTGFRGQVLRSVPGIGTHCLWFLLRHHQQADRHTATANEGDGTCTIFEAPHRPPYHVFAVAIEEALIRVITDLFPCVLLCSSVGHGALGIVHCPSV